MSAVCTVSETPDALEHVCHPNQNLPRRDSHSDGKASEMQPRTWLWVGARTMGSTDRSRLPREQRPSGHAMECVCGRGVSDVHRRLPAMSWGAAGPRLAIWGMVRFEAGGTVSGGGHWRRWAGEDASEGRLWCNVRHSCCFQPEGTAPGRGMLWPCDRHRPSVLGSVTLSLLSSP